MTLYAVLGRYGLLGRARSWLAPCHDCGERYGKKSHRLRGGLRVNRWELICFACFVHSVTERSPVAARTS